MSRGKLSPGIGKPLTLTELELGWARWELWVRKLSLQRYVAKTALSPDKQLLLSVQGLAKRWGCSLQYVYRLIKAGTLEATVIEDVYGHKLAFGVSYAEVSRFEKAQKKAKLKKVTGTLSLQP